MRMVKDCDNCIHYMLEVSENICRDCFDWSKFEIDNINHPSHYTGAIETIDYIQDKLTPEEFKGAMKFNILKYISREKKKNGLEDIKKAEFYIKKLINIMEGEQK